MCMPINISEKSGIQASRSCREVGFDVKNEGRFIGRKRTRTKLDHWELHTSCVLNRILFPIFIYASCNATTHSFSTP